MSTRKPTKKPSIKFRKPLAIVPAEPDLPVSKFPVFLGHPTQPDGVTYLIKTLAPTVDSRNIVYDRPEKRLLDLNEWLIAARDAQLKGELILPVTGNDLEFIRGEDNHQVHYCLSLADAQRSRRVPNEVAEWFDSTPEDILNDIRRGGVKTIVKVAPPEANATLEAEWSFEAPQGNADPTAAPELMAERRLTMAIERILEKHLGTLSADLEVEVKLMVRKELGLVSREQTGTDR